MESFYQIHSCDEYRVRFYLNHSNSDLLKKFNEIHRKDVLINKFVLVIEAVKKGIANSTQFNWEFKTPRGDVYAIKVNEHRLYTLVINDGMYKEYYISRYGKKESQQNTKKLTSTIESIANIEIQKLLS